MSASHSDPHKASAVAAASPESISSLEQAKRAKEEITKLIPEEALTPQSKRSDPFHNPYAIYFYVKAAQFSKETQRLIMECESSAKLIILEEHLIILKSFYENRKKLNDNLGNLYKTISFQDFILRLFNKRYKEVYLDGRAVVGREPNTKINIHNGALGKQFLDFVGSAEDKLYFKHYLALEEMVLSPLVLPHTQAIVIGTGNRSPEHKWDVSKEFKDSIPMATFSYPAAAEFRDGKTAHYDLLFISKPAAGYNAEQKARIEKLIKNPALLEAAKVIYGTDFDAKSVVDPTDDSYVAIQTQQNQTYYLNKKAYLSRTKHILKQILTSADTEMANAKLGTTFQLKGLGLGAFAFIGHNADALLEGLYLQALKIALHECKLLHIKQINLINLPTTFRLLKDSKLEMGSINNITLFRTDMEPTSAKRETQIGKVGGTVFCGDSGSAVGNEGNIGLDRSSSDDPAAQYSLHNPLILNPGFNKRLTHENCIHVITQQNHMLTLAAYHEAKVIKATPSVTPATVKYSASEEPVKAVPHVSMFAAKENVDEKIKIYKAKNGKLAIKR